MFRSLARNIFITGVAYSMVSLVGLLIAPFLIGLYGLSGYGQILLARMVLPSATFGFLDLGIGETATRAVAEATRSRDWQKAARTLTLLSAMALIVAGAVSVLVLAIAGSLPKWLAIAPSQHAGFTQVMILTAALEPLLFLSMVAEGVLKGFERFKRVRTCEVASALTYGGGAVVLGQLGFGPNWIAVALLTGLTLRFVMAGWSAVVVLRRKGVTFMRPCPDTRVEVFTWSKLMFFNKVLGTGQTQVAPALIGILIGPAAVGSFDAVVRLPRFAKSIFGLLSTTVLPLATGLKARADHESLRRLGNYGTLTALLITMPPLIFGMAYSRSIMHFWIGEKAIDFWGWQSAMFIVPILGTAIGFGGSILLADRTASQALLKLTSWQVGLQLATSLALLTLLDQWAFVLGQVLSVVLLFPFQLALMQRSLDLGSRLTRQFVALLLLCGVCAMTLRLLIPEPSAIAMTLMGLCFVIAISALAVPLVLTRSERLEFMAKLAAALRTRRASKSLGSEA
ncbi:MAG TPA: oligosaccharide flippase family protein [Sphingomicrobium sp.]|nr:oligosaccharide flippase family protein [Sphingomicrobium sp.]